MLQLPLIHFPQEEINYVAPSWSEMEQLAFEIAQQIIAQNLKFDRIVTLAKGGWPFSRSLVDFLQIDQVASIGVKFYSGINQRLDQPKVYQDIPVKIKGEKILLFDDVADTGESLLYTTKYLLDNGAAEVKTAALFYKPNSKLKPDFYGSQVKAWIIFPYDLAEMIKVLGNKWASMNISAAEIKNRFRELNYSATLIDYYLPRLVTFNN